MMPPELFRFPVNGFIRILALILTLILTACESAPQQPAEGWPRPLYRWGTVSGRTITVRGNLNDLNRLYMRRAFARYEALTGNTVRLEGFSHQDLEENLKQAFLLGGTDKPDIFLSPGGTVLEALDPEQNFYDFTLEPWVNELTDMSLTQAIVNGRVMGFPHWEASISGTLYNKALFRKFGIAVPRTQAEFLAACETLLRHGVIPVYLPYSELTMLLYQFPLDSVVQQPRILNGLNRGLLSYAQIPEMGKIVAWYRTMADRGYFGPDYLRNGWAGMDAAMRGEKYAMMLCWDTWLYTDFTGDPSRFGLMPAFMGVPEEGAYEGPNLMLLVVNRQSPQLEAARDLITFMADPYNYNVAFAGIYTAPVFKKQTGSIATPQYVEAERQIEKHLYDSTAWPRIRGFSQLDALYIQRHMRDRTYGVEDCLKDMDRARFRRAFGEN